MNEEFGNPMLIDTELQVRLMNLVMGEASDFERDQLHSLMEQRAELAAYYHHLEHLHGLLCEVGTGEPSFDGEASGEETAWQLSPERRNKVLAVLDGKAQAPTEKVAPASSIATKQKPFWSQRWMAAIAVTAASLLLGLMIFPRFATKRMATLRLGDDLAARGSISKIDGSDLYPYMDHTTSSSPASGAESQPEIMGGTALAYDLPSKPSSVPENAPADSLSALHRNSDRRQEYTSPSGPQSESAPPSAPPSSPAATPTPATVGLPKAELMSRVQMVKIDSIKSPTGKAKRR